jgi:type I restriction-modification system DNA methylase subunit
LKLHEHVAILKSAIENAYDKEFSRLGFGQNKVMPIEHIPVENQTRRHRFESMLESHIGETGDYEHAREKLVDELTFTLFNRLAAVKVMEAANLFPPIITRRAEHGGRSFGHKAWLETNPHQRDEELEGLRNYIKVAFDKLGTSLPLFSSEYPFSLFPDTISLNEIIDLINAVELDSQIDPEIWSSDDILGWCYESFNNSKKKELKDSGQKIEYNYVSLQSQVYTPRWVVQFLVDNSLGKLYLEMYPGSRIKQQFKIANVPGSRTRGIKPIHEIRIIDPACGSGNFLLYAFELFYELYLDQIENYGADYTEPEIPRLIIENNLHGIDLDDRAVQLAQMGLFIKASKKSRSMNEFKFRIVSSDFYLPDYPEVAHVFESNTNLGQKQRDLVAEIWRDLQYAYKFGSLVQLKEKVERRLQSLFGQQGKKDAQLFSNKDLGIPPQAVQSDAFFEQDVAKEREFIQIFFTNLRTAVDQYARTEKNSFMATKTLDAITFLELLTTEYDVATANPPYTDSADFGPELRGFIEDNYKKPFKFHTNLYATFIKRCYDFLNKNGFVAMLHPLTFMYIKTFEDVRKFMLTKTNVNLLAELGLGGVFANSDVQVDAAMYVLEKSELEADGTYFDLKKYKNHSNKPEIFSEIYDNYISGASDGHTYTIPQAKLKIIKSWPFIYWISDEFREKFGEADIKSLLSPAQGAATTNNLRFLRFWWEVNAADISGNYDVDRKKWVVYSKGGPFEKWYGNLWLVGNYENRAAEMKSVGAVLRNSNLYFIEGVTYSASGSKGASFRYLPENCFFDTGGSCIFANKKFKNNFYLLGFMNSKLVSYIVNCLNPTVNAQVGDMQRVPFVLPSKNIEERVAEYVTRNIGIKKGLCLDRLIEKNSKQRPFICENEIQKYCQNENHLLTQVVINEAIINETIFELYDLIDLDRTVVLAKEGESIGGLPVLAEARDAYLSETEAIKEFPLDAIRDFIESLPTRGFTAEECEKIESGFLSLYQGNNTLEEFCIRHQVNPINVWYWFKQSNVIPPQRKHTLAMEFLINLVREILMEDEDGIIPLVPNAGEKVLLDRIEEKFNKKGFGSAQYSNFDSVLGRPILEYLNQHFFAELSNHLKLYKRLPATPFIWHLSSGPDQGFDCYLIIYKWSRDNLMRLRSVYIEHRERALINRQSDLAENQSASAQTEKDLIFRQLHEIESFKSKIDELLAEGYDPILDDGVGKNIAPLQKKGMIPYEVLNPGQLKKYLNADW